MKTTILTTITFCIMCSMSLYSQMQAPVSGKTSTQQSVTQQTSAIPQLLDDNQNQAGITLSGVNYVVSGYQFDVSYKNNSLKKDDVKVAKWAEKYTVVDIEDLRAKHDVIIWDALSALSRWGGDVEMRFNRSTDRKKPYADIQKPPSIHYYYTSLCIDTAVTSKVVAVCFQGTDAGEHRRLVTDRKSTRLNSSH